MLTAPTPEPTSTLLATWITPSVWFFFATTRA